MCEKAKLGSAWETKYSARVGDENFDERTAFTSEIG